MNQFWQSCVLHLEQEFPPQQISAWIRPLIPLAFDEAQACLRLSAPNRFKLEWVRKNFAHQIETFASNWYNRPVQVLFELPAPEQELRAQSPAASPHYETNVGQSGVATHTSLSSLNDNSLDAQPIKSSQTAVQAGFLNGVTGVQSGTPAADERSRLNVELTFDNFVTGKANQLARAAALQVAENPGTSYNP